MRAAERPGAQGHCHATANPSMKTLIIGVNNPGYSGLSPGRSMKRVERSRRQRVHSCLETLRREARSNATRGTPLPTRDSTIRFRRCVRRGRGRDTHPLGWVDAARFPQAPHHRRLASSYIVTSDARRQSVMDPPFVLLGEGIVPHRDGRPRRTQRITSVRAGRVVGHRSRRVRRPVPVVTTTSLS